MNSQNKSTVLSADLNNFIYGVSRRNAQNAPDLTKTGVNLLKNFPAARDAVLEYFAMVFHDAVNMSISQSEYEADMGNGSLESVNMIGPELCSLGQAWAPFIAPWCINLIMDIATKKSSVPNTTLQNADPVRILLDITTQNLTLLNSEERAKCIDMMLGSRACSWAVGWVGRAEPALVAPRALQLGADAARAVLAHLANHPPATHHVRVALLHLFHEALREDGDSEKKREVIPYLLTLASKSDIVLKALTQDIEQTLTDEVMERLCAVCASQCKSVAWADVGPGALVALLLRADVRCLLLLLRHALPTSAHPKNGFCRQLVANLLQQLEYEGLHRDKTIPLITSAVEEIHIVRDKLLDGSQYEKFCLARVLIVISSNLPSEFVSTISYLLQHSRDESTLALLVRIVSGTIRMHVPNDSSDINLDTDRYQNLIKTGVEYALRDAMLADDEIKSCFIDGSMPEDQKTYLHYFSLNIIKLLRWENSGRVPHLSTRPFGRAVEANLYRVGDALQQYASLLRVRRDSTMASLDEMPTCHALAEILDRVDMSGANGPAPTVEDILKVVRATVQYFFRCIHLKDTSEKLRSVTIACRLLHKQCVHTHLARSLAMRELLETAMFREDTAFGSRPVIPNIISAMNKWNNGDLLIHFNQKHGPITQLTQSHTSVFHAGIIGKGVRKQDNSDANDIPPILTTNIELLMGALMSCMEGDRGLVEGNKSMVLLLVEVVSPDVMYNGWPWPDEDFTKQVSIERELYMCGALDGAGVARAALRRAARARPCLCLASTLLRAKAASFLHRLSAYLDRHTQSAEMAKERVSLEDLLSTMTLGNLLPHPLSHMLELAPELTAGEIVQVLRDCLWNYTRDHVPSPTMFPCDRNGLHWRDPSSCKPPTIYTDTLRLIIQMRISKLGHMYPIMFLNLKKEH
ncbi:unnamed protein product [Arctia plantaginis]|uniref:Integrator complex subunit 5 n=1 Tax=Arctia plantaginis TaxID=874455 RepID=A0A8S1AG70_ARCPL|nr:unnamed protein product [Arctia plantaginis]